MIQIVESKPSSSSIEGDSFMSAAVGEGSAAAPAAAAKVEKTGPSKSVERAKKLLMDGTRWEIKPRGVMPPPCPRRDDEISGEPPRAVPACKQLQTTCADAVHFSDCCILRAGLLHLHVLVVFPWFAATIHIIAIIL